MTAVVLIDTLLLLLVTVTAVAIIESTSPPEGPTAVPPTRIPRPASATSLMTPASFAIQPRAEVARS